MSIILSAALESTTYWSATAVEKPKRPAVYCYDVNGYRVHMTEDQRRADNIGKQFAVNYFGELTVWEEFLERFCDSESRYVYQRRHGRRRRPDYFVNGAADMIKFAIRAKFRHTNVKILAVYTDKYRNPNWYTSLMVCSLSRPGKEQPRTLLQSTVFKYIPSSTRNRNFTIACAVLRFVDGHGFWKLSRGYSGIPEIISSYSYHSK